MYRSAPAALGLAALIVSLAACESSSTPTAPTSAGALAASDAPGAPPAPASHAGSHPVNAGTALAAETSQQIAELRRFMAPFHNFEKAVEAGYSVPAPGPGICLSDPVRGGMGYHYTKETNLVDGVVNLLEPEFIVYSPTTNGGVRLSSADYFVPYSAWSGSEPPSLLGVPFAREDALQAYVLHIWAFWPNPAGMFENYNPDVPLCPE